MKLNMNKFSNRLIIKLKLKFQAYNNKYLKINLFKLYSNI